MALKKYTPQALLDTAKEIQDTASKLILLQGQMTITGIPYLELHEKRFNDAIEKLETWCGQADAAHTAAIAKRKKNARQAGRDDYVAEKSKRSRT